MNTKPPNSDRSNTAPAPGVAVPSEVLTILQYLALVLGLVSLGVNLYALNAVLREAPVELPGFLWALHVGVFVCVFPPFFARWQRIRPQLEGKGWMERNRINQAMMWDGIPRWPAAVLLVYAMICFGLGLRGGETQLGWLAASGLWMTFYYFAGALARDEARRAKTPPSPSP